MDIDKYLELNDDIMFCYKYGSSKEFKSFVKEQMTNINKKNKLDNKLYFKILLKLIYNKYDSNKEIFNLFITEIMQILTTCFTETHNFNIYKIVFTQSKFFNYYFTDLNNIYLNNNIYIGVFMDSFMIYSHSSIIYIESFFLNNLLHGYFSFNKYNIHNMSNYYSKNIKYYTDFEFIKYNTNYNFFDCYKYFTRKYDQKCLELIQLYEKCSNIRLIWIATCIRIILYKLII